MKSVKGHIVYLNSSGFSSYYSYTDRVTFIFYIYIKLCIHIVSILVPIRLVVASAESSKGLKK